MKSESIRWAKFWERKLAALKVERSRLGHTPHAALLSNLAQAIEEAEGQWAGWSSLAYPSDDDSPAYGGE